ncbi:hypothetical protein D3C85_1148940 [compost metagenome]
MRSLLRPLPKDSADTSSHSPIMPMVMLATLATSSGSQLLSGSSSWMALAATMVPVSDGTSATLARRSHHCMKRP